MNRFFKFSFLLILLVLFAFVPVAQSAINYVVGQSLYDLATVGVVDDTWQYMQKPELYYRLQDAAVVGMTPTQWGSAIVGGVDLGLLPSVGQTIFMVKYQAAWTNVNKNSSPNFINGTTAGNTTYGNDFNNTPNNSGSDSLYNFALGQDIKMGGGMSIGLMYDINIQDAINLANQLGQQVHQTNGTQQLYNIQNQNTINNADTSVITHTLEASLTTGTGLYAYIQARIIARDGDSTSQNFYQQTTGSFNPVTGDNYLTGNVIYTRNGVTGTSNRAASSILGNINNLHDVEVQIAPEAKYELSKIATAYLGFEVDSRSLIALMPDIKAQLNNKHLMLVVKRLQIINKLIYMDMCKMIMHMITSILN